MVPVMGAMATSHIASNGLLIFSLIIDIRSIFRVLWALAVLVAFFLFLYFNAKKRQHLAKTSEIRQRRGKPGDQNGFPRSHNLQF